MYILDSILKNVQGYYINLFQARMPQLFPIAFQNATSDGQRRSLIKLLNVWSMFLNPELLQSLYYQLNLHEYVSTNFHDVVMNDIGGTPNVGGRPPENCPVQERVSSVLASGRGIKEREL